MTGSPFIIVCFADTLRMTSTESESKLRSANKMCGEAKARIVVLERQLSRRSELCAAAEQQLRVVKERAQEEVQTVRTVCLLTMDT